MIKARTKERNFGPSPSFTPGLMAFKLRFSLLYDPLLTSTLPEEIFFVNHLPACRAWQWSVFSCWISWLHFCVLRNLQIKQDRLKKDRALIRRLYCRLIICRLVVWTSDSFQNFRLLDLAFGSLTEYFWYRAWISGIIRVPTKRWRQTVEFFTGHDILTRSLHPRSTKTATWIAERGITLLEFHSRVYVMFIQSMSDHCESNKRIFFSFFLFFFFQVTLSHHFGEMGVSHAEIEECWWSWHDSVYRATLSDCFQSDGCVPHAETGEIEECR